MFTNHSVATLKTKYAFFFFLGLVHTFASL